APQGRLDTGTKSEFEKAIEPILLAGETNVTVDLSDLEYISSSGLRLLLILQKNAMQKKGTLNICNIKKGIMEVFNMTGFTAILHIQQ
ncbi:MAG: STAS domain-containing protein, partial [Tannerellaceae bacterium]